MIDPVYKHIEITGTSTRSIEESVSKAIQRALNREAPELVSGRRDPRQHQQRQGAALAGADQGRVRPGKLTVATRPMDPKAEESKGVVENDLKTHDQLPAKTKELLLLQEQEEKSIGQESVAIAGKIQEKSK